MMFKSAGIKKSLTLFLGDRAGNFAMITAIAFPVVAGFAGAGLELTRAMQMKSDLQSSVDAATLAAATEFRVSEGKKTDQQLKDLAADYITSREFAQEFTEEQKKKFDDELESITSRNETVKGKGFKIATTMSYDMPLNPLLGLIGAHSVSLKVTSTAESSFNKGAAMSMYLVLDRSGSMSFKTDTVDKSKWSCQNYTASNWGYYPNLGSSYPCYVNKSTSLKTAVGFLVTTLNKSDPTYKASGSPESELVRTGAIAYNDGAFSAQGLDWGTKKSNAYVQAIPQFPQGGTNANAALNAAFDALKRENPKEANEQGKNHNGAFQRYIVLMTDGEMTGASSSWNHSIDTQVRATCEKAKADEIKIFTIAFMAPERGKSLLRACATSEENYYAPENMDEIVTAFGDIARKASSDISRLTN